MDETKLLDGLNEELKKEIKCLYCGKVIPKEDVRNMYIAGVDYFCLNKYCHNMYEHGYHV